MSNPYPITRHMQLGIAAPGANTSILGTALTPTKPGSWFRVTIAPRSDTNVTLVILVDGVIDRLINLNGGASSGSPTGGAGGTSNGYSFDHPAPLRTRTVSGGTWSDGTTTLSYNYRIETDGIIDMLHVEEIAGKV